MLLFCPYANDICIHKTLKNVDCPKCVWNSYGHNADDFEDTETIGPEDENEIIDNEEEDFEAFFMNHEDIIPFYNDD